MAGDANAERLVQENNIVGLFQYLGPMWIVVCMEILEDMLIKKKFYPNPDRYRGELARAGIYVERMEVAMAAALHKVGRSITWGHVWAEDGEFAVPATRGDQEFLADEAGSGAGG